jgi:hypothetical protein
MLNLDLSRANARLLSFHLTLGGSIPFPNIPVIPHITAWLDPALVQPAGPTIGIPVKLQAPFAISLLPGLIENISPLHFRKNRRLLQYF